MLERSLRVPAVLDLPATFGPLGTGFGDPTLVVNPTTFARGTHTPEGPAALLLERPRPRVGEAEVALRARAWGPGAGWVLECLPDWVGLADRPPAPADLPEPFAGFARRASGLRLARTHRVVESLALVVLQQLVQGREAARAWRNLVLQHSERAPGPLGEGWPALWLPPSPELLQTLPPAAFPPLGVLERQAQTLRRVAERAPRLEEAAQMSPAEAEARLRAVPGVGVWSARSIMLHVLGHADAVVEGDYHLATVVVTRVQGMKPRRSTDAEMLALLEPVKGERGRAQRWITARGGHLPRRAPRRAMRPLPRA